MYLQLGHTPLHWAAQYGQLTTVQYLIEERGAEVDVRDVVSQRDEAGCGCMMSEMMMSDDE